MYFNESNKYQHPLPFLTNLSPVHCVEIYCISFRYLDVYWLFGVTIRRFKRISSSSQAVNPFLCIFLCFRAENELVFLCHNHKTKQIDLSGLLKCNLGDITGNEYKLAGRMFLLRFCEPMHLSIINIPCEICICRVCYSVIHTISSETSPCGGCEDIPSCLSLV